MFLPVQPLLIQRCADKRPRDEEEVELQIQTDDDDEESERQKRSKHSDEVSVLQTE